MNGISPCVGTGGCQFLSGPSDLFKGRYGLPGVPRKDLLRFTLRKRPWLGENRQQNQVYTACKIHMLCFGALYHSLLCPSLHNAGGFKPSKALFGEVVAWLDDLCDSSVFFDFPFSQEGRAEKIHPVVAEQPTKFINRQGLMDVWLAVILA